MQYKYLSESQITFFLQNGYVVIKSAFTRDQAAEATKDVWTRLDMDPNDKSTWIKERTNMPWHKRVPIAEFAPKAWGAVCELLGGAERIDEDSSSWGNGFIVNLGTPELEAVKESERIHPRDLQNWHVDGDFFVHYLDSPEQALLTIPVYTDIREGGAGTYICPEGIPTIAKHLAAHPEGCLPSGLSFTPSTSTYANHKDHPEYFDNLKEIKRFNNFVELTADVGDVVLLHPLMLHSASKNYLRIPRIITNPPAALKEPFNFDRENPEDYSLVERKTLLALGVDRFQFKPTTERRRVVPQREIEWKKVKEAELQRLARTAVTEK